MPVGGSNIFVVAFKLADSTTLLADLKTLPAWWHYQLTGTYFVAFSGTMVELRARLAVFIKDGDQLIVWELIPKQWAALGFDPEAYRFLHTHFGD